MTFDVADQAVLVTGASRGIGKSIAHMFAEQGARVALHYHRQKFGVEQVRESLPGSGHIVVQADLGIPAEAKRCVDDAVLGLGRIDILINNAGLYELHPPAESSFEQWLSAWSRTIDTNLSGAAHTAFAAAQHMIKQGGGRIVNISSRGAFRGEPEAPAYGASKAGLNAFSQSMAKALAPFNIFVYAIAPGWVETDMAAPYLSGELGESVRNQSPLGRVARPEEVAHIALFLSSPGQEFMTGAIVDINGASYLRT